MTASHQQVRIGVSLVVAGVLYLYFARPTVNHYPNRAAVIAAGLARADPLPHSLTAAATSIELETWKPGKYKYVRRYWAFQVPVAVGDSIRRSAPALHLAAAIRTFDRPHTLPDWPPALLSSGRDTAGYAGVYVPNEDACVVVSPDLTRVYVWPCRTPPN